MLRYQHRPHLSKQSDTAHISVDVLPQMASGWEEKSTQKGFQDIRGCFEGSHTFFLRVCFLFDL